MNRTNARELMLQVLFQMEIQGDFSDEAFNRFLELNTNEDKDDQMKYMRSLLNSLRDNKEEIDKLIETYSKGWKLSRIAKVDLSVMRICLSESYYMPEGERTPVGAAISEAVKMAKKFGTDDSGKFVNGILGEISRKN